jgi:D-alanyl-D-alanine carboxypeptidase
LPASSVAPAPAAPAQANSLQTSSSQANSSQAMAAYADPASRGQPQAAQQNVAIKPAAATVRSGWLIQVGALESEGEARQRIDLARNKASGLLSKADPFTEPVVAKDNRKLFRARFAGLERDQAEAVCKTLKRADISCITVRN